MKYRGNLVQTPIEIYQNLANCLEEASKKREMQEK
jgi:hypothetical protein